MVTIAFALLIGMAVLFFASREYVRKETVAGFITPSSGVTTIRAERGGRLLQRYGSVGARVEQGDLLFESQIDIETSDGFVSQRQFESATERLAELESQLETTEQRYRTDRLRLTSQVTNIESELEGLQRRLRLQLDATEFSAERRQKMDRLYQEEVASLLEAEQARSDDINQNLSLELIRQQIVSREGALMEARFAMEALPAARERELSQIRQQIAQIEETRTVLRGNSRYQVRSPISGTITAVQGNVGQTLSPSTPIFVIVPDDAEMIATLLIPTRAAGFVDVGQSVNLLVDAFPYQKFGVQSGRVSEISSTPYRPGELDAPILFEEPVYRVKVELVKETVTAYGEEMALKAGMTLQGDVITDQRSLLEWMLDPLFSLRRS